MKRSIPSFLSVILLILQHQLILTPFLCCVCIAVTRKDDTPDGHLLGADTLEKTKQALQEGANINVQDEINGQTAIMRATLHGWTSIVKYLLQQGADVTIAEKDGYTPAHGAGFQGRSKIMKLFIEKGVDVLTISETDGFTPFHRACWGREQRHTDTVRYFLQHGVVDDVNMKGGLEHQQTCFQMTPNSRTKALLIEYGAGNTEL